MGVTCWSSSEWASTICRLRSQMERKVARSASKSASAGTTRSPVRIGLGAVQRGQVVAVEVVEPAAVHLGQVAQEPPQGQVGRRAGGGAELVGGQALDLPEEGVAVEVEEAGERRLLVRDERRVDPFVGHAADGRPATG